MESDPEGALAGFAEVVCMEPEKSEWWVSLNAVLICCSFVLSHERHVDKFFFKITCNGLLLLQCMLCLVALLYVFNMILPTEWEVQTLCDCINISVQPACIVI